MKLGRCEDVKTTVIITDFNLPSKLVCVDARATRLALQRLHMHAQCHFCKHHAVKPERHLCAGSINDTQIHLLSFLPGLQINVNEMTICHHADN